MKCPCHSGADYSKCCAPYHNKEKYPETPFSLMRSRYSAYALGLIQYIIETTHPKSPHYNRNLDAWSEELEEFCDESRFENLEIINVSNGMPFSFVKFIATIKKEGSDLTFSEHSRFQKEGGRWLYLDGEVTSGRAI